ncbi:hypothetical protein [uncultured Bradyrhizobium sp.]|jgi:hypothetical protein|uniref:hypothetical protein n=1 Tax=uncultured Bradyrhizobium sp. TaxID=199684 RepID=UPI00261CD4D9|nr:hypothetical protein [uncultured Bradyrhizobium sp.]
MIPFSDNAVIVDGNGRATRALTIFLQNLFSGVIQRTTYTYAQIALLTPSLGHTVICTDSSVVTVGNTLAGGGANIVQAVGNGTDWKVF